MLLPTIHVLGIHKGRYQLQEPVIRSELIFPNSYKVCTLLLQCYWSAGGSIKFWMGCRKKTWFLLSFFPFILLDSWVSLTLVAIIKDIHKIPVLSFWPCGKTVLLQCLEVTWFREWKVSRSGLCCFQEGAFRVSACFAIFLLQTWWLAIFQIVATQGEVNSEIVEQNSLPSLPFPL